LRGEGGRDVEKERHYKGKIESETSPLTSKEVNLKTSQFKRFMPLVIYCISRGQMTTSNLMATEENQKLGWSTHEWFN
jgi:hypothetical protein